MENNSGELSLEQLNNALSGVPYTPATEKALENSEIYRQKMIEDLKAEKEKLEQMQQEESETRKGR